MKIYVATAYTRGPSVESVVRPALHAHGVDILSSWHESASGEPEKLQDMRIDQVGAIYRQNRLEILAADAILVLDDVRCRETYAEAEFAHHRGVVVHWVRDGRTPILSIQAGALGDDAVHVHDDFATFLDWLKEGAQP